MTEEQKPLDVGDLFGGSDGSNSATPEIEEKTKEEVVETAKEAMEAVKQIDEHHQEWLRLVALTNEAMAGRYESDIPLSDNYWECRKAVQLHQAKKA